MLVIIKKGDWTQDGRFGHLKNKIKKKDVYDPNDLKVLAIHMTYVPAVHMVQCLKVLANQIQYGESSLLDTVYSWR